VAILNHNLLIFDKHLKRPHDFCNFSQIFRSDADERHDTCPFTDTNDIDCLGGVYEFVFGIEHIIVEARNPEEFRELRIIGCGDDAADGKSCLSLALVLLS